jgi:cobalt/nickel transport system permease protein
MTASSLDAVAWQSRWRTRSVAEKVALCGGLLLCAVLLPPWPAAPLVLLAVFASARLASVPWAHLLKMLAVPLLFIVVAATSTAVTLDSAGPFFTTSTDAVHRAANAVGRSLAATAALMLLASTTPMSAITTSLRRLGVPAACADVITAMYRMVFLLLESVAVVRKSQTARLGYSSVSRSVRSAGLMTAAVLIRAWRRAHALERGLAGRSLGMPLASPAKQPVSKGFLAAALSTNLVVVLACLTVVLQGST